MATVACKKSYPDFEWRIDKALSVLQNENTIISRPPHEFCNKNWILSVCREVNSLRRDLNFLHFVLFKEVSKQQQALPSHEIFVCLEATIVGASGEESRLSPTWVLKSEDMQFRTECQGIRRYQSTRVYVLSPLTHTDALKTICKFRCLECPVKLAYVPIPSDQEINALKRKCPEDVVEFVGSKEKKKFRSSVDDKLLNYIKTLLSSGLDSDVTIKVGDREFNTHRLVLRATSEVFDKMFSHPMLESQTGEITIDDCSPDAFQKFLEFAYSGELDLASHDVVFDLYYIAEKYDVQEVIKICSNFILEHLTVGTFVESFSFAELHQDSTMLEEAYKFFFKNVKLIIATDEWLSYLKQHTVRGNELMSRTIDHYDHAETKN